jgi:hypothetical protein
MPQLPDRKCWQSIDRKFALTPKTLATFFQQSFAAKFGVRAHFWARFFQQSFAAGSRVLLSQRAAMPQCPNANAGNPLTENSL